MGAASSTILILSSWRNVLCSHSSLPNAMSVFQEFPRPLSLLGEELAFADELVLLNVLIVPVLEYPNDNTSIGTVRFRFLGSSFLFT